MKTTVRTLITAVALAALGSGLVSPNALADSKSPTVGSFATFYVGSEEVTLKSASKSFRSVYGAPPILLEQGFYSVVSVSPEPGRQLGTAKIRGLETVVLAGVPGTPRLFSFPNTPQLGGKDSYLRIAHVMADPSPVNVVVGQEKPGSLTNGKASQFLPVTGTVTIEIVDPSLDFVIHTKKVTVPAQSAKTLWIFGGGDRANESVLSDERLTATIIANTTPSRPSSTTAQTVPQVPSTGACAAFPELKLITTGSLETTISAVSANSGETVFSLAIPSAGLRSDVLSGAPLVKGELTVPVSANGFGANQVHWYQTSAKAGDRGSSIVLAHVNWGGRQGPFSSIGLGTAPTIGSDIIVTTKTRTLRYKTVSKTTVRKDQLTSSELCKRTDEYTLFLVTCGGKIIVDPVGGRKHYDSNVIVKAILQR